jgi:hypothetical protein
MTSGSADAYEGSVTFGAVLNTMRVRSSLPPIFHRAIAEGHLLIMRALSLARSAGFQR